MAHPHIPPHRVGSLNYLLIGRLDGLLDEVDKVWWAEFAKR